MQSDEVSTRVKHYVTWRLVAELMRRHKASRDLYVMELHPAGGQGDTLGLYEGPPWEAQSWFNDFRGFRRLGGELKWTRGLEEHGGYVWPWLQSEDPKEVVDAVESALGWPQGSGPLPAATPTVRAFRLMADVLGHALHSRQSLQWRSAWMDSSGMGGSWVREEFLAVRPKLGGGPTADAEWPGDGAELTRWWMLVSDAFSAMTVHAVVDLGGRVWSGPNLGFSAGIPQLVSKRGSRLGAALDVWVATGLR